MATPQLDHEVNERERVRPYAEELMKLIRQTDPEATFSLDPPFDPGIWLLNAFLTPPLDSDPDFLSVVTERAVDFEIEHGVSIAIIPLERKKRKIW